MIKTIMMKSTGPSPATENRTVDKSKRVLQRNISEAHRQAEIAYAAALEVLG